MPAIEIFTDGACLGNPGPGGYGTLLRFGNREKALSQGYFCTTNNRMEMMAVIAGLKALKVPQAKLIITVDSQYVKKGVMEWLPKWKAKDWRKQNGSPVLNKDLWMLLDALLVGYQVEWVWVKGHQGHPENTRCDRLAQDAAKAPMLSDTVYEQLSLTST